MSKKKTARNENKRFLSVGPVKSRDELVRPLRDTNLRAMLKQRLTREQMQAARHEAFARRIEAALKALGKDARGSRKGD